MKNLESRAVGSTTFHSTSVTRFLNGVVTIILASILGGTVGGYLFSFIWVGPHAFWQPIDKNIGLDCAVDGIIAGYIVGIAGLAWLSNRRQSWTFFLGGLAAVAVEVVLFLFLVGPRY